MDAEFDAQWGLAAVKAEYALAKGLTGAGIDVVIVDLLIKQHIRSSSAELVLTSTTPRASGSAITVPMLPESPAPAAMASAWRASLQTSSSQTS